jgi:hypothetical protein
MELFYIIVLSIAVLFLIILLTSFGVMLKRAKKTSAYPQRPPYCPDGWNVIPIVNADGTIDYKCKVPDTYSGIDKLKTFTNSLGNTVDITNSIDSSGGNNYINFYNNVMWQGSTGACNKYNWAKKNSWSVTNGTISWDGITNVANQNFC